ncbi:MAG: hypothetical protein K1X54_06055 [Flavobacteriales bacterium]|nr:hypothetical protein [Flavobacteriales bacterium]
MDEISEILSPGLPVPDYQEYYRGVITQIRKDFHPYTSIDEPEGLISPEWIFQELSRMVHEVLTNHQSALGQIIYRVDLPEKKVRSNMMVATTGEKPEILTRMILRREAQKVWIRLQYKA